MEEIMRPRNPLLLIDGKRICREDAKARKQAGRGTDEGVTATASINNKK
jgi:hypothetical protein